MTRCLWDPVAAAIAVMFGRLHTLAVVVLAKMAPANVRRSSMKFATILSADWTSLNG